MSEEEAHATGPVLWPEDTGELAESSRRVLLKLLRGPFVSGAQDRLLWQALIADERIIRSRLNDLFLELVIDTHREFAFIRKVRTNELTVPSALNTHNLKFMETVMLLTLRRILLASPTDDRVIISFEEVAEQLSVYRHVDEPTFNKRMNAAWTSMVDKFKLVYSTGEGRFEISPVVRFLVDDDRVAELTRVYREIAQDGGSTHDA